MNRREFIARLKEEISRLPQEEIEAAVEYYEEYFDEAGADKEQDVLERLGSPKKVASQIKSEYAVRLFDEEEKPTVKKGLSAAWYVVLGICSAPVSIPLAVALGALAISIFVALICCVIGVFAGIAGWAELYGGHGCAAGYGSQSRYSGDSEDSQATERKAAHKESAGGRRTEKVALQRRAGRRRERCVTDITD